MSRPCRTVVMISGQGNTLQAIIDAARDAPYAIGLVLCDNPDAYGLIRAEKAGLPAAVVDRRLHGEPPEFDLALVEAIENACPQPDLIILAGFMRILSPAFIDNYPDRILNLHPSLLPAYPGLNTHRRVLEAGDREHGASVHFVNEKLDAGPVVARTRIPVDPTETAEELRARLAPKEQLLLPEVIQWFATGRLRMRENVAILDDVPLPSTGIELDFRAGPAAPSS